MLKQLFFFYSLSDSILSSHHPLSTISFSVLWKNKVAFELMLFCQSSGNTVAISFHWSKNWPQLVLPEQSKQGSELFQLGRTPHRMCSMYQHAFKVKIQQRKCRKMRWGQPTAEWGSNAQEKLVWIKPALARQAAELIHIGFRSYSGVLTSHSFPGMKQVLKLIWLIK